MRLVGPGNARCALMRSVPPPMIPVPLVKVAANTKSAGSVVCCKSRGRRGRCPTCSRNDGPGPVVGALLSRHRLLGVQGRPTGG